MPAKPFFFRKIVLFTISLTLLTCTNPVSPEYQFMEGLIYIEGFIGTTEGSSYVKITESDVATYYRNIFVSGANVAFVNADSGEKVILSEGNSEYNPSSNFKGNVGEKWYLEVSLPNGNQYLSEIETINPSVAIKELSVQYDKQLEFIEDYNKYVPGHEIAITFDDPADQTNYYYWRFKTYDKPQFCKICEKGLYRNNDCILYTIAEQRLYPLYYTYWCDSDCWQIDYGSKIQIFSDEFSNGTTTSSLPIANVLLTRKTKILVEVEQFSLTPEAYNYYRTIKDLINNNGGFNSPLPAALIGNIYNPEDSNEYVLGRFTASSATTKSIMVDRTTVEESPIDNQIRILMENDFNIPILLLPPINTAPCEEGKYRTSILPEGWIE